MMADRHKPRPFDTHARIRCWRGSSPLAYVSAASQEALMILCAQASPAVAASGFTVDAAGPVHSACHAYRTVLQCQSFIR